MLMSRIAKHLAAFFLPIAALGIFLGARGAGVSERVTIITPEAVYLVDTESTTVGEVLDMAGIEYDPDDIIIPPALARVEGGDRIRLHRLERRVIERNAMIPFDRTVLRSSRLVEGSEVVLSGGREGRAVETVEIIEVDGEKYGERIISREVLSDPLPERIIVGTRRGRMRIGPVEMVATAYTPGVESCEGFSDGRTATMARAGYGIAAVDPSVIPLGTDLYIPGYGYATAMDVGGAIKGARIDLCMSNVADARNFGRREVLVYILD